MPWSIVNADVVEWARDYKGPPFHALLTDCPYEYGFQNKVWDSTGISFSQEMWASLGEHLNPGAFGITYGGSRTWHRIAVAIEDAGFIIHPTMFGWLYSSGFPKGVKIDTAVDKRLGVLDKREIIGKLAEPATEIFRTGKMSRDVDITRPHSELAAAWEEHRYGIQALKPALEPLIFFQKPYDGDTVQSIIDTGSGALWIDGTKIRDESDGRDRWPSNFAISHHPGCTDDCCHLDCPAQKLDDKARFFFVADWQLEMLEADQIGFFSKVSPAEREAGLEGREEFSLEEVSGGGGYSSEYQTAYGARKSARRNPHPTMKPISLNKWIAKMLLPPPYYKNRSLLIPFSGVASEGVGAMMAGWDSVLMIDKEKVYCEIGALRMSFWKHLYDKHGIADPSPAELEHGVLQTSIQWDT